MDSSTSGENRLTDTNQVLGSAGALRASDESDSSSESCEEDDEEDEDSDGDEERDDVSALRRASAAQADRPSLWLHIVVEP